MRLLPPSDSQLVLQLSVSVGWPEKILNMNIFIDFKGMRALAFVREEAVPWKTQCEPQHTAF